MRENCKFTEFSDLTQFSVEVLCSNSHISKNALAARGFASRRVLILKLEADLNT